MHSQIVLASEFQIDPHAFLAAWKDDADCRGVAVAERVDQPPAGYPMDPGTVLIFLGGVATTIATEMLASLTITLLKKKLFKEEKKPAVKIVVIQQAPGTRLLVVKGQDP